MDFFSSKPPQAQAVQRAGIDLKCDHCAHDLFFQGEAQLHSQVATLFGMEGWEPNATYYACERCGRLHWFRSPESA
ncbi:hypothetical protein DVJ83_12060 [Deinococcus wulumuqiensis]|uniref:DNA-binding protein n=1 Tax=Deinococcus wulumuqiensis TaxID=980427 RepID=A0A345IJ65_9DEIO|nr:hypothetical protein DVJ83_12060 [Deinococcus wulumuqiensis]